MKNVMLVLGSILCVFASSILPISVGSSDAFGKNTRGVVLMVCEANIALEPPAILVRASSSGGDAPVVAVGSDCGSELAALLSSGFDLREVRGSETGLRVFYTLTKGAGRQ